MSFNITEAEWDSVIQVHLKGHMAMCHHAVKHWRALGKAGEDVSGRIINTASESGLYGQAGQVNYSAAKAGIVSMTIVIAREMKKYGVTANVVCPRALTRMTATVAGAEEFMQGPEWAPENISPIVAFLASDAAADVSGQIFVVFGTRVHLMEGFTLVNTLDRGEGRWTPEELIARKDDLFAGVAVACRKWGSVNERSGAAGRPADGRPAALHGAGARRRARYVDLDTKQTLTFRQWTSSRTRSRTGWSTTVCARATGCRSPCQRYCLRWIVAYAGVHKAGAVMVRRTRGSRRTR